jgi:YfiH family protein
VLRLAASNLDLGGGIAHAFFGRKGGVSEGIYASLNCGPGSGDDRAHVIENRRRAMVALSDAESGLATLYQVHGREAVIVRAPWEIGSAPRVDAMATDVRGLALGILTADCAPILMTDPQARVVGAAHAGWKGALAGVIESAIAAMERLGARRDRIAAAIGPHISQDSYEVGDELRASIKQARGDDVGFFVPSNRTGHWRFDLGGYTKRRLQDVGIENVSVLPACTYRQEAAFFSFRRATHRGEPDYGRQLSAIMLV